MSTVRLSDVIIPTVYNDYEAVDSPEKTALWQSGVVSKQSKFDRIAEKGGNPVHMPFWNDLDADVAPNLSTDNPADVAVPDKVGASDMTARLAYLNKGYSDADLVAEIIDEDPMTHIRNRFGTYWMRQWQRRLIANMQGILADNIANDSGDMVFVAGDVFSRSAFTSAAFTLGDRVDGLSAIVVHSDVMKQMVDQDDIDFIQPSDGGMPIPFYMGKRVVVDDSMPVAATAVGQGDFLYTSILFGPAAFGYGEGTPAVPVEIEREASQGNGGGVETIWERKTWLLHPFGFSVNANPANGLTFTLAELAAAATWNRVIPRKNIPVAFLQTTLVTPTP